MYSHVHVYIHVNNYFKKYYKRKKKEVYIYIFQMSKSKGERGRGIPFSRAVYIFKEFLYEAISEGSPIHDFGYLEWTSTQLAHNMKRDTSSFN